MFPCNFISISSCRMLWCKTLWEIKGTIFLASLGVDLSEASISRAVLAGGEVVVRLHPPIGCLVARTGRGHSSGSNCLLGNSSLVLWLGWVTKHNSYFVHAGPPERWPWCSLPGCVLSSWSSWPCCPGRAEPRWATLCWVWWAAWRGFSPAWASRPTTAAFSTPWCLTRGARALASTSTPSSSPIQVSCTSCLPSDLWAVLLTPDS